MTDPIVKTVTVNCSAEHAFNVFVYRMADWWPLESHAVSVADGKPALNVTVEPKVGGSVTETKHNGTSISWGTVQVFEPAKHFAMTWHPGTNQDKPTRVDVEFTEIAGTTQVTLTHSGWEIWGDEASGKIAGYTAGWDMMLETLYAPFCEG